MNIEQKIRSVKDYPKEGIDFKDITTLLKDKDAFKYSIDEIAKYLEDKNIDLVVGPEARGFIMGTPVAYAINAGFVPVRKPGKLPADVEKFEYELEYGTDTLEIHKDAILKGQRVAIVDDLLATGGTTRATAKLIEKLGGEVVAMAFLIELEFLNGRDKVSEYDIKSLVKY